MKWLVDEEDSETALALRHQDLVAPALMRIEAGNVLRTLAARQAISNAEAQKLFAFLQTAPVVIVDPDDKLEKHALELALELGQPIYDCVFLALAHRTSRTLVTADGRFIRALAGSDHAGSAASLEDLPELIVAQR